MTDDELLAELARIAAIADPPPELVGATARAALSTRRLDVDLARLIADSAVDDAALVRSGDAIRLLSFEHGDVSVELQVEHVGGRVTLRGLVSGGSGAVAVDTVEGERAGQLDPSGWFTVDDLPPGPLRVRLRASDGTGIATGWVAV